jgi:hypothetical protein
MENLGNHFVPTASIGFLGLGLLAKFVAKFSPPFLS